MKPPGRDCPTLITARLTLSPVRLQDHDDSLAMWSDPVVLRYLGGVAASAEDIRARQLRYAGLWSLFGYGYWIVRERGTERFVGEVGFADFLRNLQPSLSGCPEAGWALATWAHGQGFAGEATAAMFDWVDRVMGAPRTVCMIDPENRTSLALADRLGFRVFARSEYKGKPTTLLERSCPAGASEFSKQVR